MNNSDKLDEVISKIALRHEMEDTKLFFSKVQLCLIDCIFLIKGDLIVDYEKLILTQAKSNLEACNDCTYDVFKNLRILIGLKRNSEKNKSEARRNVLDAINGALLTYEDYEPNEKEERISSFDYCLFYLKNAGVSDEDLSKIIKIHFNL